MAEADCTPLKSCTKCGEAKPEGDFYGSGRGGLQSACKACANRISLRRYHDRQAAHKAAMQAERESRLSATEKRCGRCLKMLGKANFGKDSQRADGLKPFCKACHNEANQEYRRQNPGPSAKASARWKAANPARATEIRRRFQALTKNRVHQAISARVKTWLRGKGGKRTEEILGYGWDELRPHLERQFTKGMSWDNYGEWHIDHIVPLSSFDVSGPDDPAIRAAWALTNLRPLWAKDNRVKSGKRTHLI